jgi:hypothetical protein
MASFQMLSPAKVEFNYADHSKTLELGSELFTIKLSKRVWRREEQGTDEGKRTPWNAREEVRLL